ncbi:MAG: UPF0182 family protein [Thermoleophilaceae bacterium]
MATVERPRPADPRVGLVSLPSVELPRAPSGSRLWSRALGFAAVLFVLFLLDQLTNLLMQYWFLESLGFKSVFWTNFKTGAILFAIAFVLWSLAVIVPVRLSLDGMARRRGTQLGLLVGLVLGIRDSRHYLTYLPFFHSKSFHQADPIYHHDIGFYVFKYPAIVMTAHELTDIALVALIAGIACAWITRDKRPRPARMGRAAGLIAQLATPFATGALVTTGVLLAIDDWLRVYALLWKDNTNRSIPNGASNLDVTGIWSNKHAFMLQAVVLVIGMIVLAVRLRQFRTAVAAPDKVRDWRVMRGRTLVWALLPGLIVVVVFQAMVGLRNQTQTTPNEPVVQYPFIKYHIDATNHAWGLDHVQVKQFVPKDKGNRKTPLRDLLKSPSIQNAPLWPGYTSWLERIIDPEYANRILQNSRDYTKGWEEPIYGPTLSTYHQQQKLRPYYDFMDVDTTRYYIKGKERLFASSVRELPLNEPKPWLSWWGQRYVVFTHGYGLVMSMLQDTTPTGEPVYDSANIPVQTSKPEIGVKNPSVYYGEGAGSMAFSDVANVPEHDHPTAEGRAQIKFPKSVKAGITVDSPLKRIVLGYKARSFMDIFFSNLIKNDSRVHLFRTPIERAERIAPFLFEDTDPYAVTDGNRIKWMVNGISTSNRYPYSEIQELGDESDRRTPLTTWRRGRWINYARDSVKTTIDAYTGQVHLYKWQNEPVINMWQGVYPKMFQSKAQMPARLKQQVQYPTQLFHTQFDDEYIYTHQQDPLTYFSQEDVFDDANEVVGPVLGEGKTITFSKEPYYWVAQPGQSGLPPSSQPTQFTQSQIFTPENALNLRAIVNVYQDGADYGKISVLEIPKGRYFIGPEQADAAIDQDPFISQQMGLWTRRGLELIRGHTTPLLVDGELIYVEPEFIRSKQNPLPRLKRVVVVYRGNAYMAETLRTALKEAIHPFPKFPIRPGPELGGEPPFIKRKGQNKISQSNGPYTHTTSPSAAQP